MNVIPGWIKIEAKDTADLIRSQGEYHTADTLYEIVMFQTKGDMTLALYTVCLMATQGRMEDRR